MCAVIDKKMSSSLFSVSTGLVRDRSRRTKCITVSLLGFAIFIILLAYSAFGDKDVNKRPEIKVAYVIFRHGDRNPTEIYPTSQYNDQRFWPGGWGALTNKGKNEMYNLGTFLQSRYKALLGSVYSPNRLLVRSSDNDRCLMSAGALLAGLQPPSGAEVWLPGLNWQPIPVHATPRNLDKLIVVKKKCPRYDEELKKAYKSAEILKVDSENADLYEYLSSHSGLNISSVLDVEFLFSTLEIEEKNGFKLPKWTEGYYPEPMKNIAKISMAVFTQTLTMKQLVGGPLINDIKEKMYEKVHGSQAPESQVYLISGHDMTLINVLRSLGLYDLIKPDMGATLLFELHAGSPGFREGADFVKIFYMHTSTSEPLPLTLKGCNELCPVDEYLHLISKMALTPNEWEEMCQTAD